MLREDGLGPLLQRGVDRVHEASGILPILADRRSAQSAGVAAQPLLSRVLAESIRVSDTSI